MHLFKSCFEAVAAYGIHRKERECLRECHTIRAPMQELDMCIYFSKNRTENHFPEFSFGNRPLHQQSRSACQ